PAGCVQSTAATQTHCTGANPICNVPVGKCAPCSVALGDLGANDTGCATSPDGHVCQTDNANMAFCGCGVDADCGAVDSGRVCNGQTHKCQDGCSPAPTRNHCPQGRFCSTDDVSGNTIGMCTTTCNFDPDCSGTPQIPLCLLG